MPQESFDAPPILGGVHVLLVENDSDSLEVLKAVLEYTGALVSTATSAREALGTLERIRPDVIVSDIAMPGDDGYWLVRQVRAQQHTGTIPAVAVTVYNRPEDRRRALDAGFQAHLSKPVDPWEFCRLVGALARRA
jgi:CheY-like chemotaxis protein